MRAPRDPRRRPRGRDRGDRGDAPRPGRPSDDPRADGGGGGARARPRRGHPRPAGRRARPRVPADARRRDLRRFGLGGNPALLLVETPYYGWPMSLRTRSSTSSCAASAFLLAHPERNADVQDEPEKVRRLVEAGVAIQLTAGSVDGRLGRRPAATEAAARPRARPLHRERRPCAALRAVGMRDAVAALGDEALGRWLTEDVPAALLEGGELPLAGRRRRCAGTIRREQDRRSCSDRHEDACGAPPGGNDLRRRLRRRGDAWDRTSSSAPATPRCELRDGITGAASHGGSLVDGVTVAASTPQCGGKAISVTLTGHGTAPLSASPASSRRAAATSRSPATHPSMRSTVSGVSVAIQG